VRIARENAARAGVAIDARQGNASQLPFGDNTFDFVVCMAAFKNFSDPVGALDEIHRVLRPGAEAAIIDLRKDATRAEIDAEVSRMGLSWWNALVTRWTFRFVLLRRAYSREHLEGMVRDSRFRRCSLVLRGIGSELRLRKEVLTPASRLHDSEAVRV
jgi:ubiquinone/menaquinone biosynthesis C-methylase UbiE